jgi:IclR family acetate operon transcriptional repressor
LKSKAREAAAAKTVPVRSLKKALDILDLIIEADLHEVDASLAGLAQRMGIPSNTAHNLLKTMVACGYVRKNGHGLYVQGVKCRQMGRLNRLEAPAVHDAVQRRLQQLTDETGEGCLLTVLMNGERVVVARVDSAQAIRVSHATIEDLPFFSRATGRALAAHATAEELEQIVVRHGMPGVAWDNIATPAALRSALAKLREEGGCMATTPEYGLIGLACPVTGVDGSAWGVLGLYAPAFRCSSETIKALAAKMQQCAADLSGSLSAKN